MTLKEQTDLLGWKDITTNRQMKNGTIIYRLPIKKYGQFIEVGSFESGYVRRMNGGYTPYQLNKCEPNVEYYPERKWVKDSKGEWDHQIKTGKYIKFVGKRRIKIMSTRKRVQYLIDYCLKNYYINQANEIENGNYIPKWRVKTDHSNCEMNLEYKNKRIKELKKEVTNWKNLADEWKDRFEEIDDRGALDNLSVIVNNERYKII